MSTTKFPLMESNTNSLPSWRVTQTLTQESPLLQSNTNNNADSLPSWRVTPTVSLMESSTKSLPSWRVTPTVSPHGE
ncbi:hypothetical protein BaRGS_00032174 [Batillaria attramentaria]|uniref:Uncharacterized protein n=1 Tax=Batillaria attramentaria TaxID=370345 RepID=A0ABD0JNI8_9CAEN